MVTLGSVAAYISAHFQIVWGSAFIGGLWKFSRFVSKIEGKIIGGESTVNKMATNDLPHIHGELTEVNTNLKVMIAKFDGVRDVLLTTRNNT